jgi:hypothetical protein
VVVVGSGALFLQAGAASKVKHSHRLGRNQKRDNGTRRGS